MTFPLYKKNKNGVPVHSHQTRTLVIQTKGIQTDAISNG